MGNSDGAENQAATMTGPRRSKVLSMTLDTTARRKSLGAVVLANMVAPAVVGDAGRSFFLTMIATVDFYFVTAPGSADVSDVTAWLDPTAADVANTPTPTFVANACSPIVYAGSEVNIRLDRWEDYHLIVKGTGAGVLKAWASSEVWRG